MEITFTNILTIITSLVLVLVGYLVLKIHSKGLEWEKEMKEYVDLKNTLLEERLEKKIERDIGHIREIFGK